MQESLDDKAIINHQSWVLFKSASIGIVIVNANGEIINTNPFLLNLFGYKEEELLGNKIELLIPRRYHHNHDSHREKYVKNPKSRPMGIGKELFGVRKNGSEFPVEISLDSYEVDGEKFVLGFIIDITIRKNDHAEIERLNEQLETSVENRTKELTRTLQVLALINEKLETALANQRAILDNTGVILFAMNKSGIIQFFNPEACRVTGYLESEVVYHLTPVVFFEQTALEICKEELFNEYAISFNNDFDVIKEKANRNQLIEFECVFKKKDDSLFPVILTITAIKDKSDQITGYMGVATDITERKKSEANLLEALSKEKKLGELKSRFVSMASHEFRTPLSTILSSAYLVDKYTETEHQPKREKHLHRIISSVNSLINILNEFLSVGKIEEGKIGVHLVDFNIKKTIELQIQNLYSILKKSQFIEYTHYGKEEVNLDPSLLQHILMNLLSNAIKFSPEGSIIHINSIVENDEIQLSIKDNGIGISKEDQEHLMERFFRGSNTTNIQGTGLGLHIVSKYVERMNGRIEYQSELEKGTTFTIVFKPQNLPQNENDSTN